MKRILFSPEMHDEAEEEVICSNGNYGCESGEEYGDYHTYCGDCKIDQHNQFLVDMERGK